MHKKWRSIASIFVLAATGCLVGGAHAQERATTLAQGNDEQLVPLPGATLKVFSYVPKTCTPGLLLVVFHGVERNAGPYRDHAQSLADHLCAIVVSPEFDQQRFPRDLYQYGGVMQGHAFAPPGTRTVDLVSPLVAWARGAIGKLDMPFILIGYSAGGQFVGRVAAFTTIEASRIVIGSPSTWVMPSLTVAAPFGFAGAGSPEDAEHALRRYLALPIVVLLDDMDTGTHNLTTSAAAMDQGANRLSRGRNAFKAAQAAAQAHGWSFGWTLVEVHGVGHDATATFSAPETIAALSGVR